MLLKRWRLISDSPYSVFRDALKPLLAIAIVLILFLFISQALTGFFSSLRLVSNFGAVRVVGVGVYWDINCTSPVNYLDWGELKAGSMKNITVFVRNEGSANATLFLNTSNWNPPDASKFITLGWDYDQQLLQPTEIADITLTLTISSATRGLESFKFDVVIGIGG